MTKKRQLHIQKSEEQQLSPKVKRFRTNKEVKKLKKKVNSHERISEQEVDTTSMKKSKKSIGNNFAETAKNISDPKNQKKKKNKRKRLRKEKSDGDLAVSMDERLEEINDTREVVKALEITSEQSDEHLQEAKPEISEEVKNLKPILPTVTDEDKLNAINSVRKQADQALSILRQFAERSMSKSLFPEVDQVLHIQCVYKKPALANDTPIWNKRIVLPHPLRNPENTTVCLIMADIDRSEKARFDPDVDKQSRKWEDILREAYGITRAHVHKILTKRQLEREYGTYLEKRQLASAYDIFLVDSRVAKNVWHECGKEFHKARKMPFSVDVSRKSLIEQIARTYSMITLPLSPNRTRVSLVIGNLSQPHDHLLDNVQEAIARLFDSCPGGLLNVRSLYLQIVTGGPTIPIYADTGSANDVRLPFPKKRKDRPEYQETIGELSTLPEGLEVAVRADGKIRVIDSQTKKSVYYPTINDEWEQGDDLKPRIDPEKIEAKRAKKLAKKKRRMELMEKRRARMKKSLEDGTEESDVKKKKKQGFDAISKALQLSEKGKRITSNESHPSEDRKKQHKKHSKHFSLKLMKRRQKHKFMKKSKISA
uniref:Ribosomal L1 domain-containing protein n=1 Tax=Ascaris suum TaxID=6253 RepID=F1KYM1_ASCSU